MEIRDLFYIASLIASIAAALFGIWKSRKESQTVVTNAAVAVAASAAVEKALLEERLKSLERRLGEMQAEVHGVRAGFESGIGRVHDSLGEISKSLQELKTEVAVINALDARPARGSTRSTRKVPA